MSAGRLEAQITVPTVGWSGTIDDSGGGAAVAWSVAGGTYFWFELISAFSAALNTAAPTDTITVTIGNGENGTGRVTITSTGVTAIVWVSTDLRDLLGYTTNLTGSTSYVAPQHARALWIAQSPYLAPNEVYPWAGWPKADFRSIESAAGQVWAFMGQKKETASLAWDAVPRSRASKANEVLVGESFQRFVEDGVWGLAAWGTPAGPVRFFSNADLVNYVEYYVTDLDEFVPSQFADGWAGGPWKVQLPRLVVVGTGANVPIDGPLGVFVPEAAIDWTSLGLPVPDNFWPCQDTSGDAVAASGGINLTASGGTYQNSVAGWTRKFLGTTSGADGWRTSSSALDIALNESFACLYYVAVAAAAGETALGAVSTSSSNAIRIAPTSLSSVARVTIGGSTISGGQNHSDINVVRPWLWGRNVAASVGRLFTNLEQVNGTYSGAAATGTKGIGSGSIAAQTRVGGVWFWRGANAETILAKTTLQTLGWSLPY